jgi:hypothetical protein
MVLFIHWRRRAPRRHAITEKNKASLCLRRAPFQKDVYAPAILIVQRIYDYAVKETVELRVLTVFEHIVDPARVRTVAGKDSAITPLDLRPTVAE